MTIWDSIADAFSKNGAVTKIAEQIPVVGQVTAGIQAIAGNTEEAKRALATSTGNLVSAAGAVGGFLVGGPPGAVAGGSLGGLAGTYVTSGLAGTIDDPAVKGDLGDVTAGKVLTNVGLGAAGGLIPGGGGLAKSVGTGLTKELMKDAAKVTVSQGLKGLTPSLRARTGDEDDVPGPRKYVSQINKTKSDAVAAWMHVMAAKYPVTPVSGPCLNAAGPLGHMIVAGQPLEQGVAQFEGAIAYFSARFQAGGQYFQGGIDQAVVDLMSPTRAQPGTIVQNGAPVPYSADQIRAMLNADYDQLLSLFLVAAHSFEHEFDEH